MKTRTITIPKGYKISDAIKELRKLCSLYAFDEENIDTVISDRTSDEEYTVSFQDTKEADEELKNLSADDLKEKGIKGITLLERLLLEIYYFKQMGKHLDVENVTLCTGSRYSDGDVPRMSWYAATRLLYVDWYSPSYSRSYVRARAVVSNPSPLNPLEKRVEELEKIVEKITRVINVD